MFGRATIRLGVDPHSSYKCTDCSDAVPKTLLGHMECERQTDRQRGLDSIFQAMHIRGATGDAIESGA